MPQEQRGKKVLEKSGTHEREHPVFRKTVLVSHIEYKKGIVLTKDKSLLYPEP